MEVGKSGKEVTGVKRAGLSVGAVVVSFLVYEGLLLLVYW